MTDRLSRKHSTGTYEDILDNVQMIRRNLFPGIYIHFECYNLEEVNQTKALLTEDEKKQVRFFWLTFGEIK